MSLADKLMHYTHRLSDSMHSQLWRREQHEGEEGEIGNSITTTQCNAWSLADGCIILTICHVPCIPSCARDNNMRGRKEKQQLNNNLTMQRNVTFKWINALYSPTVMFQALKGSTTWGGGRSKRQINSNHTMQRSVTCRWMDALYSLPVMFHAFPVVKRKRTWGGGRRKRQLKNNHTMQRNVTCRWMDALYSLAVMFHAFPVVKRKTTWGGGRRIRQLNNNHTMQRNVTCRWMDALY